MTEEREALEFDVVFIGGGPANLAGAIHLMNLIVYLVVLYMSYHKIL